MLLQQSTKHEKYHGKTGYLLGNIDAGIREFVEQDAMWMTWR